MNRQIIAAIVFLNFFLTCSSRSAETNHDFQKWEKEISAFEQSDRTNPPPKGAVLFAGSSGIRLWKTLASDFPDQKVINRGFGGCEIVDVTHFADRIVFPYAPRKIVFRCGGNDLWDGKSPATVFQDFVDFANAVHAKLPETEIIFVSWNSTIARQTGAAKEKDFNERVKEYIQGKPYLKYVEAYDVAMDKDGKLRPDLLAPDKLHFSPAGYARLTKRVKPALKD